jgi:hypothetical protein
MNTSIEKYTPIVSILFAFAILPISPLKAQSPPATTRDARGNAVSVKQQVDGGSHPAAKRYYLDVLKPALKIDSPGIFTDLDPGVSPPNFVIENSRLDLFLSWMGYTGEHLITTSDLHALSSKDLMAKSPETILASRFFAPKISDVSTPRQEIPAGGFGWRKLVVLKPRDGSRAMLRGFTAMYLLQNTFAINASDDPYVAEQRASLNNQVILTRGKDNPDTPAVETAYSPQNRAAYFLMFGELVKVKLSGDGIKTNVPDLDDAGKLQPVGDMITNLKATFDNDTRIEPESGIPAKDYFAPGACINCHGEKGNEGKVNFLDTDHWFDRVTPNYGKKPGWSDFYSEEDFTALAKSHPVLYDQKEVTVKESYRVLREINKMIEKQNDAVDANSFQRKAVVKWLINHAEGAPTELAHVPPVGRAFGNVLWDNGNEDHKKALYFLNRYCYRCHSSVKYNVFDMESVVSRIRKEGDDEDKGIINRVKMFDPPNKPQEVPSFSDRWMPQDRVIEGFVLKPAPPDRPELPPDLVPEGQLKEFLDLLEKLSPTQ